MGLSGVTSTGSRLIANGGRLMTTPSDLSYPKLQLQLPMEQPKFKIWVRPARLSNPAFAPAFWARVEKWPGRGPNGDCWEWTGYIDPSKKSGYGMLAFEGKTQKSHRVAWILTNGEIPDGMQVLHKCDHRPCVNPNHLFLGTNYDNVQDKISKGRHPRGLEASMYSNPKRGSDNWHSRFSDEEVLAMRAMYASGSKCKDIATAFKLKDHVCNMILHGRRWAHLPGALPPNRRMAKQIRPQILEMSASGMRCHEIARATNFSDAAISRVLNGKYKVSA